MDHYAGGARTLDIVTNLSDRHAVLAYASEPRSTALGATPEVENFQNLDLQTIWPLDTSGHDYADHFWHSAQFRGDCWQEWNYWNTLLRSASDGFDVQNP